MIRLLMTIGLAIFLWPVDEDNRPLGFGGEPLSGESALEFAQSTFDQAITYCERNADTCEAATTHAASFAYILGDGLRNLEFSAPNSDADPPETHQE